MPQSMPESMQQSMPESTFAIEVLNALPKYLESHGAQTKIIDAIDKRDIGNLGRIFNELPPPMSEENTDYLRAMEAYKNGNLDDELREVLKPIAKGIFNEEMSDLTKEIKESIGIDNYDNIVKLYGLPTLIDAIISSLAMVYSYANDEQFKQLNPMPPDKNSNERVEWDKKSNDFQLKIQRGLAALNASKDFLTSPTKIERVNPTDGLAYLEYIKNMSTKFIDEFNSLKNICKADTSKSAIEQTKRKLGIIRDNADECIVKCQASLEGDHANASKKFAQNIASLSDIIHKNFEDIKNIFKDVKEPVVKTKIEVLLNVLKRCLTLGLYGYESKAEKTNKELAASPDKLSSKIKSFAELKDVLKKARTDEESEPQQEKKPSP